jgi:hypothetical protein
MQTALETAQAQTHAMQSLFAAAKVLREAQVPANSPRSMELFPELLRLGDQDAMRRHVQASTRLDGVPLREAAGAPTGKYAAGARKLLAKEGLARPDGSYPIRTAKDVEDAVADFNRVDGSPEDKAHIIERAKAVDGGTDALPADWSASTRSLQESAAPGWSIPTVDGRALGPTRLREARSAADLSSLGVPILSDSPLAGQRPSELPAGIPVLPVTGALSRTRLTESVGGSVLRRVS